MAMVVLARVAGTGVIDLGPVQVFNADAEILGLTWSDDKIVLTGNEYLSLYQRSLDFIDVDGSIRMSLHIADATPDFVSDIYTWDVADQPWREGDLLMLRIRKTDAGATIISQVRDLTMLIPTAIRHADSHCHPHPERRTAAHADSHCNIHSDSNRRP